MLVGYKEDAIWAKREDVRAVWEAISHSLLINYMNDRVEFEKERGEEGWQALELFLNTPDKEWQWSGRDSPYLNTMMDQRAFAKSKNLKGEERVAFMQTFNLTDQDLESEEEDEVKEEDDDSGSHL